MFFNTKNEIQWQNNAAHWHTRLTEKPEITTQSCNEILFTLMQANKDEGEGEGNPTSLEFL